MRVVLGAVIGVRARPLAAGDLDRVQRLGLDVAAGGAAQAVDEDRVSVDDDGACFAAVFDDLHRRHGAHVSTSSSRRARFAQNCDSNGAELMQMLRRGPR
jgi:hypothetical protein